MKQAVFLGGCTVLAVVPFLFVLNKVYNDRVVGRLALLGISFAAWTFIFNSINGVSYADIPPQFVMLVVSAAVFMAWHYLRFYWRIVGWQRQGKSSNDIQQTVQFNTYADICRHRGSRDITVRLCRNPAHEAANTGIAICAEKVCPDMGKVADGRS